MSNKTKDEQDSLTQLPTTSSSSNSSRTTTTVRHRLPRRKVNDVWKSLSTKTCDLLQDSLVRAIDETKVNEDYASIRRIEMLTKKLTTQIRVPVGVYTGIKLDQEGKVDLMPLEDLKKKNSQLESFVQLHQRISSTSDSQKINR